MSTLPGPLTFMAFLVSPGIAAENLQNSRSILCPSSSFTASVLGLTFTLQGFPSHVAPERGKGKLVLFQGFLVHEDN